MNKKQFVTVGCAVLLLAVAAGLASAQTGAATGFRAPFSFLVNGTEMASGRYEISAKGAALALRNLDSGQTVMVKVTTRISNLAGTEAKIVFDKTPDMRFLSEVHLPGLDGFAIEGAPGEHAHELLGSSK